MATTSLDLDLIPKNDITKLYLADTSIYGITINNPSLEVTPPGFNKVNVIFTPQSVNILDAATLNVVCSSDGALPDGIYKFKYSVAPNLVHYVEKSFMRTTAIECKYARLFLGIEATCSCGKSTQDKLKSQLRDAKMLIEGSIAAANQCDVETAYEKYLLADKILDRIKPCDC